MERLTERKNGTAMIEGCGSNCKYGFEYCRKEDWENCKTIEDVIDKLADYEDLEEQGRLVKLPCNVGDTVYKVNKASKKVSQHKVIKFEIDKADATSYTMQIFFENFDFCFLHHFGETVFLTKSEAEQKLKEMESD